MEQRASELAAQFEQRAQETIGELSQKARAKVAKTKREFRRPSESIAPCLDRTGRVRSLKLEPARACA